jgi:hypothetical protein
MLRTLAAQDRLLLSFVSTGTAYEPGVRVYILSEHGKRNNYFILINPGLSQCPHSCHLHHAVMSVLYQILTCDSCRITALYNDGTNTISVNTRR